MSDENGRFIFLLNNGSDVVTDRKPGLIIQSGKRLIQQKEVPGSQPASGSAPPSSGACRRREFRGPGICKRFQAVFFEHLFYPGKDFPGPFFNFGVRYRGSHFYRWNAIQRADPSGAYSRALCFASAWVFFFEKHLTGLRWDQPCDDGEDGRFSTPAGPDDGEKFSGKNLKGQIGEGAGLAAFGVVGMGYIFNSKSGSMDTSVSEIYGQCTRIVYPMKNSGKGV